MKRPILRAAAAVLASSVILTGCGSGSDEAKEPQLEWGRWQEHDKAATVFASADNLALLYEGESQQVKAYDAEGKQLWEKRALIPPTDDGTTGPVGYLKDGLFILQDPTNGTVYGLNAESGDEEWRLYPRALGKCKSEHYRLVTDPAITKKNTVVVALEADMQNGYELSGCSGESAAAAGYEIPEGASGEGGSEDQEILKPAWKAAQPPEGGRVDTPAVDPTGTYLTQVLSGSSQRMLQRTKIEDGSSDMAVVTKLDNPDPAGGGNVYGLRATDADNYAVFCQTENSDISTDIYSVGEWSAADKADQAEPSVKFETGSDSAECLLSMSTVADKPYCYTVSSKGAKFAALDDNLDGAKLETIQHKPVSPSFSQGMEGAGLPTFSPAGITADGTVYGLVPSPNKKLEAISMADGETLWSSSAKEKPTSAAMGASYIPAGKTMVYSQDDTIMGVSADNGEKLWSEKVEDGEQIGWLTASDTAVAAKIDGANDGHGRTLFRVMTSKAATGEAEEK